MVYMAVALIGSLSVLNGVLSVGMLVSFLSYANQYTKPFNEISGVITELQNAIACLNRVFDLIYEDEYAPDGDKRFENANGTVEFKNVYFSYSPDKPLIEDFSLKVNPGETIAIVGPTGCGKTTLIKILANLLMRYNGDVLIDGKRPGAETKKIVSYPNEANNFPFETARFADALLSGKANPP